MKHWLATKKVLMVLSALLFVLSLLIANFILFMFKDLFSSIANDGLDPQPFSFKLSSFFEMPISDYPIYYCIAFVISGLFVLRFIYLVRTNYKDLNQEQKGSSRFTTEEELKKQYKAVPERKQHYKGNGGVVISRLGNQIFIDDSPVNNLIIGTTRSGKGETFVFPCIDVYSRAEFQPSLILNDPKGELFTASRDTLIERGYHIEVLNLQNPMESMSYNLLQLVKEAYKEGDYSTAQALCKTLTHTLYYNPNAKDPFWQQCAMSLCNAMILAITDKCIREGQEEKITMYTVANMLSDLGSQEVLDDEGFPQNALDIYFQSLPSDSVAKMQYATSNFSKGTTRGGIFTQTMNALSIFTFDEIAKMTSENSLDLTRIGFGKQIKGTGKPNQRITLTIAGKEETVKTNSVGLFELHFKHSAKIGDSIELRQGEEKLVVRIWSIQEENGVVDFEVIQESSNLKINSIVLFEKPTAIFMITPDYDSSNHVIASIFIRQLYFVLAKYASLSRGGKCHREVVFLLDEFGNMPSIEGMANIITVCLGRNIRFNLIIQAYSQLKNKYGDDAPTIDGNCGNTIYILTNDQETADKISKKLGDKTINSLSRNGQGFSLDKNKTEGVDGRPLLTASELKGLQEGESVVLRVIKRTDQNRNRITAYPIFNTDKTRLKYRWEYLAKEFDTDKSILDIDIPSLHENLDIQSLAINWTDAMEQEEQTEQMQSTSEEKEKMTSENKEESKAEIKENAEEAQPVPEEVKHSEKESGCLTVEEWFETDPTVYSLVSSCFMNILSMDREAITQCTLDEFQEHLHVLAHNDQIPKNVYQVVENKLAKFIEQSKGV
ncbi:type IV secretory system conjugative DNA transfer family protein [Bacillus sp. JJ722]